MALATDALPAGADPQPPVKAARAAAAPEMRVAHSALLSVDATTADDSVVLHIRHVRDQSLLNSDDVTVAVDGKAETVTRSSDGSYVLPASNLRGAGQRDIEIVVGHDGIREVLSGKIALPESSSTGGLFRNKQVAWWILNVAIVLIAAIALSRRKR